MHGLLYTFAKTPKRNLEAALTNLEATKKIKANKGNATIGVNKVTGRR